MPRWTWRSLSPERKLDVVGILLALVGLLTLLSLFSSQRGELTGGWVHFLYLLAGYGAFLLPLALIAIGLWLVFRNLERLPLFSAVRLTGIILMVVNLMTLLHMVLGGGWTLATEGSGGGYIGALFERLLVVGMGQAGALVVLAAWFLISLVFIMDISIPELFHWLQPLLARFGGWWRTKITNLRAGNTREQPALEDLPPDFQPLPQNAASASTHPRQPAPLGSSLSPETQTAPLNARTMLPVAATWTLPSLEAILDPVTPVTIQASVDKESASLIEETLASFGAPGHVVEISRGPTITMFGVEPDFVETRTGRMRVRVGKIASLVDDLALALAASRVRIQAPVPGRSYVGIEVPNAEISRVSLREVVESEPFQKIRSPLRFALGKDVAGKPAASDLANMPHLLIAGTTGSGKSVCVNAILCTFLLHNTPLNLRLVLVDPKRVELTGYNGLPHLLAPVVVDAERVVGALQWMLREMDTRYHKFSQAGVRNIQEYRKRHPDEVLPYLLVVIDELADLIMLAPDETERSITRLAQLARATGIHLIIATQRPSVDVITGLIKANFPARIAFAVASGVDSRVILDQPGAERLLGRGDMLFQAPDAAAPVRLQGAFVSESEIQRLVDYWRLQVMQMTGTQPPSVPGSSQVDMLPRGVPLKQVPLFDELNVEEEGDPMMKEAVDLVRREGRASITMLQRRLRVGYTRAARLIDRMEEDGIIGPSLSNSQVREVLDYGPTAPPKED